jgi:hypothetical protein
MVFHVMASLGPSVMDDLQRAVPIAPLMAIVPHVPIVLIARVTVIVPSAQVIVHNVQVTARLMVIVHNVQVTARLMVIVHNVQVTARLMVIVHNVQAIVLHMETARNDLQVIVLVMEIVMVLRVKNVLIDLREIARLMATEETAMLDPNAEVMAVAGPMEHPEENVLVEIAVENHPSETAPSVQVTAQHMVTAVHAQNVVIVLLMVIVLSVLIVPTVLLMVIVLSVPIALLMVTGGLVQSAPIVPHTVTVHAVTVPNILTEVHDQSVEIVRPMVIARSDLALVSVVAVLTGPVLPARVAVMVAVLTVILVLKNLNLLKNSEWHANCAWFALTTMTLGLMTMSLTTCSTRVLAMSLKLSLRRTQNA